MLILPAKMSPKPLNSSDAHPKTFKCEICGRAGEGRLFKGAKKGGEWAVLPEEWEEVVDKRPHAKKKFVLSCSADCSKVADGPTAK
jgi:hypothetical protein